MRTATTLSPSSLSKKIKLGLPVRGALATLLALFVATFVACNPFQSGKPVAKEVEITGQVFITLKNRDTVKLSLTPVLLVNESEGLAHVEQHRQEHKRLVEAASARVEAAKASLASANEAWRPHLEELTKLTAEVVRLSEIKLKNKEIATRSGTTLSEKRQIEQLNLQTDARVQVLVKQRDDITARHAAEQNAVAEAKRNLESEEFALRDMPAIGARPFPDRFPGQIARAITDADGKFRFKVPAGGRYLVVAQTSRELPILGNEVYSWVVNVDAREASEVNLHNENKLLR